MEVPISNISQEDVDLVIDFMKRRQKDFERFMSEEHGLSPHAATFIIEDLEFELKNQESES